MLLLNFFVLVLASRAVLAAWFEGSIFAGARATAEAWDNWLGELLGCRFCLSYHVPFWLLVVGYVPGLWLAEPWQTLSRVPIYSLAVTGLLYTISEVNDR